MSTRLRSNAASILLAIIGTALSGTIAAFVVIMIYFMSLQLAAAGASGRGEAPIQFHRSMDADRCRPR